MNLVILNSFDGQGGAAIATYRLHRGLREIGINSRMLVQGKSTGDYSVIGPATKWQKLSAALRPYLDVACSRLFRKDMKATFSCAWVPDDLASRAAELNPSIVHLFWINAGFLRIETLRKFKKPIVWTLHDMWPFTGGCHYDEGCGKFQQSCGACPVLHSGTKGDLSRRVLARKRRSWMGVPIVVVATSRWIAEMARKSSLFADQRVEVIPNGLDTDVYKPLSKAAARAAFGLPLDKHLILFSAFAATSEKRKGGQFLAEALEIMSREGRGRDVELMILGATQPEYLPDLGMKVHYMGYLRDEISQVLLYSAADVLVAPSMQENLSNTVLESLACGTPVVAFDIGGMPDMIEHHVNGYLATPFLAKDLAGGIGWLLADEERRRVMSRNAREIVLQRYSLQAVASQYAALYESLLK